MSDSMLDAPKKTTVLATEDPYSLFNKLPQRFQDAIYSIPDEYLGKDEIEITKLIKPSQVLNCLRLRIWSLYSSCMSHKSKKILIGDLLAGICSKQYFYSNVLTNDLMTAYILTPPISYETAVEEVLNIGVKNMRDIMVMPIFDSQGKFDARLARLQFDIAKHLDARIKGAPTQRIENKVLSLTNDISSISSTEEIDKKLKELEKYENAVLIDTTGKKQDDG